MPQEEMKAGRELDALVAERIMGLKLDWNHSRLVNILNQEGNINANLARGIYMACEGCGLHGYGREVDWGQPCPSPVCGDYSTDIADAWKVFNHVMENALRSKRQRFFDALQEQASSRPGRMFKARAS